VQLPAAKPETEHSIPLAAATSMLIKTTGQDTNAVFPIRYNQLCQEDSEKANNNQVKSKCCPSGDCVIK